MIILKENRNKQQRKELKGEYMKFKFKEYR